jgi:hypothetical protein
MNKKLVSALVVLMLASVACGLPSIPGLNPVVSGGDGVQATVAPPSNQQSVLFQDDFSDSNSGWDHSSTQNGSTDYESGGYRIHVDTANYEKWANPSKVFQDDVRIEVDATKTGGPDNNDFGVLCRYQDTDNYYQLVITSDGYAAIIKLENGKATVISSSDGKLQSVDGINSGAATNHIRADCIGSDLSLYANGTQVATASDSSYTGGDVGLSGGTYDTGGTDILFDNFYVYAP